MNFEEKQDLSAITKHWAHSPVGSSTAEPWHVISFQPTIPKQFWLIFGWQEPKDAWGCRGYFDIISRVATLLSQESHTSNWACFQHFWRQQVLRAHFPVVILALSWLARVTWFFLFLKSSYQAASHNNPTRLSCLNQPRRRRSILQ